MSTLSGIEFCHSGLAPSDVERIRFKVQALGGTLRSDLTDSARFLLMNSLKQPSLKYEVAVRVGIRILRSDYIDDCYVLGDGLSISQYHVRPFEGTAVALRWVQEAEERLRLREMIVTCGGTVMDDVHRADVIVVPDVVDCQGLFYTYRERCVCAQYVTDCFDQGCRIPVGAMHKPRIQDITSVPPISVPDEGCSSVLAQCIVYLTEHTGDLYMKAISLGALVSWSSRDSSVTHVVHCGGDSGLTCASSSDGLDRYLVSAQWLEECFNERRHVDETDYLIVKRASVVSPPDDVLGSLLNEKELNEKELPFSLPSLRVRPSIGGNLDGNLVGKMDRMSRRSILCRRSELPSNASDVYLKVSSLFQGLVFCLKGYKSLSAMQPIIYQIESNGGTVTDVEAKADVQTVLVCNDGSKVVSSQAGQQVVSDRWITHCLASQTLLDYDSSVLFVPSDKALPIPLTMGLCIYCLDENGSAEKSLVQDICRAIGFRYVDGGPRASSTLGSSGTQTFSRIGASTDVPIGIISHVIYSAESALTKRQDVIDMAAKSRKPVVNVSWLEEILLTGKLVDVSKHRPQSKADPTSAEKARSDSSVNQDVPNSAVRGE